MRCKVWCLLAFMAPLSADDVILHSGEVIEGKIDRAATDAANKGKTNPNDIVLVIVTDEAGTKKTIKNTDVKYIVAKKPSWEIQKEARLWYEKEAPKVKDTLVAQENFGRQCRSKGLEDQAKTHFVKALEFRRKDLEGKPKITADERMKLADWCRKAGLLDEEKKEVQAAIEIKKAAAMASPKPVKELVELADWLARKQYDEDAMTIYQEVLKIEPQHAAALQAVKSIKENSGADMKAVVEEYVKANRAWKITVAVEDDVDAAFMKEWEEKLKALSDFVFEITEGQFFVYEWVIEDQTSKGQIIVEKGKSTWGGRNGAAPSGVLATCFRLGTPNWYVLCPGKVWVNTLVHEMFHGIFGLLDEYYQNPQCPCVMRSQPSPQRLCTPETHKGGGRQQEPCIETVKKRYKDVSFPNPNWKSVTTPGGKAGNGTSEEVDGELNLRGTKIAKAPQCKVVVIDR